MKKIDFLPTKIKYNSYSKNIELFYRVKNNDNLHKKAIPYDHYIFISPSYHNNKTKNDYIYKHLKTDEDLMVMFIDPKDAYEIYSSGKYVTGEADINPEQRFMCDNFYNTEFPTDIIPRINFIDIETYVPDGKLPTFKHNLADINAITLYDNYTEQYYSWFIINSEDDPSQFVEKLKSKYKNKFDNTRLNINIFKNSKNLLASFLQFIKVNTPDIMTSWNSRFDIPYIVRKIYDYFDYDGLKELSPFNTISSKVRNAIDDNLALELDSIIPGIDVIDMLLLYKKYTDTEKPSYSLKEIAAEELGEAKLLTESGSSNVNEMYDTDFELFCLYNIQDVRLIKLLEDKLKMINLAITIRNISKVNFQDIFFETKVIDNLFVMKAVKRRNNEWKYVLPSKPRGKNKQDYLGAFVKPPIIGRFKWVADLDFRALYPSIDKTFTLSLETIVGRIDNYQLIYLYLLADEYNLQDNLKCVFDELLPRYLEYSKDIIEKVNKNEYNTKFSIKVDIETKYKPIFNENVKFNGLEKLISWLYDNNYCLLPNGIVVDQNVKDAIIPEVIAEVMEDRDKYKSLMKKYLSEGNEYMHEIYDMYQLAVKLINNSIYGVTASEGFRLFSLDIAEGITSSGQVIIRASTYIMNKYMNQQLNTKDKDYVITNDTDSIIFTMQDLVKHDVTERDPKILSDIASKSKNFQDYVNESIYPLCKNVFNKNDIDKSNNYLMIKNEWLADSGLFVAKKCYAVHMVFKEGYPYEKLHCKGISLRRSSTPKALKPFLENILISILSFKTKNEIDQIIIEECRKIKEEYTLESIALPISIKSLDLYEGTPIQVRGTNIWNNYFAKNDLEKIVSGKVKYIYVKKWENQNLNLDKEYVLSVPNVSHYWDDISTKIEVDYEKMKERLIIKPSETFYKPLNWDLPKTITTNNIRAFDNLNKSKNNKIKLI